MTNITRLCIITIITTLCFSCTKKSDNKHVTPTSDYVIVGTTGGYTMQNAKTRYYLVSDNTLKADTLITVSTIPTDYSGFHFNYTLPKARYDSVASGIISAIPVELLSRSGESIGTMLPDAGYTDVRVQLKGKKYNWQFEYYQTNSSTAVQQFVQKLNKILY